jgi:vitamin B12 transporter
MRCRLFVSVFFLFMTLTIAPAISANDDVIQLKPVPVKAIRSTMSKENIPSSITIITEEEIKKKKQHQVINLLREELGMDITQTGPLGGTTNVFMRGASGSSTLVLIDGIQVNSNTTGAFEIANLTTDNIEQIEIIRGPQSTLWGSDAVGGVINIITKKGKGAPSHSFSFEGGSFETFKETANSSGDLDFMDYSVTVSRTDSEGFSAANEEQGNTEDDGYENTTVSTRLGRNFLQDGRAEFIGRYTKSITQFDSFGPVDGGEFLRTESAYMAFPIQKSLAGWWDVKINPTFAYEYLKSINISFADSNIFNRTYGMDLQNNVEINRFLSTTFGFEYESRNGVNEGSSLTKTINNQGYYLQGQFQYDDRLFLTAGFRHDVNSVFEDPTTHKFEGAYRFKKTGTRIRAAYATGFRAPSLNELFFPNFGTPTLKPEESTSWEASIDQTILGGDAKVEVTYFEVDFENLIESVDTGSFVFRALNVAQATTKGVETAINILLPQNFNASMTHTWLQAVDGFGSPLQRRAKHNFSFNLSHTWKEKLHSLIGVRVRSATKSNNTGTKNADAYSVVRAVLSYDVNKNLKITARGENLFNEKYEELAGFGTAGVSGYAGFTYFLN